MKKDILFTFDYELFLGKRSGSIKNCLIEPTEKILALLNRHQLKGIFFVDTTYLLRLRENGKSYIQCNNDYLEVMNQLKSMVQTGHYIYPHLHPHWKNASYNPENNSWNLENLKNYCLKDIASSEAERLFQDSIDILNEVLEVSILQVKIDAYRAGGWSIQPFKKFKPIFKQQEIIADFSVLGGNRLESNGANFNFENISTNCIPYRFEEEVNKPTRNGTFKQYPISSIQINKNSLGNRIVQKVLWRIDLGKSFGKGIGAVPKIIYKSLKYENNYEMMAIELLTINKLNHYKNFIKRNNYIQIISHPKMISKHNLWVLEKLLRKIKKYEINSDWKEFPVN